jgi:hypothetical protein
VLHQFFVGQRRRGDGQTCAECEKMDRSHGFLRQVFEPPRAIRGLRKKT